MAASFALPLNAAPIFVPKLEQVQAGAVEQVNHRRHWRGGHRRHAWRSCRYYERSYPRHHYSRHYGYRDYYPRYHRRSGVTIYFNF